MTSEALPAGIPLWWYVTALTLAMLVIGIAKAGFGGGVGILAVPLVASALPAGRTLGVMLPLLILADWFSLSAHLRRQSWPHLRWLLFGAAGGIGAALAVLLLMTRQDRLEMMLNLLVGSICLCFVLVQVWRLMGGSVPRIPPGPWGGRSTGLLAGLTSTLAHAAGPVVSIYLLEQEMEKRRLVGTMLLFFAIVNLAKLPVYVSLGMVTGETFLQGLVFAPMIPLGVVLGLWMNKRIPEKPFAAVMYLGAAAAAGNMLYKALV
ncbi:MAG: sulfite exporter TauE/SafE family protein [Phycisphaeraceae bacterium]